MTTRTRLANPLLLLLAAALGGPPAARGSDPRLDEPSTDAIEIFGCRFDEPWDINYDGWPDGWRRHDGPDHPHYVEMTLVDDADAPAGRALEVRLDGAQARLTSPEIRVAHRFSYMLRVRLKTRRLTRSSVHVAVDFLDARGRVLQTESHKPVVAVDDWTTLTIGPVRPRSPRIERAVVRIEARCGDRGDLRGSVSVGSVSVIRWPSMEVTTNSKFNVYTDPDDVVITCSLSGIGEQDPTIRFQLLDATSKQLAPIGKKTLDGRPISFSGGGEVIHSESLAASDIIHGAGAQRAGYEGSTDWRPPLAEFGPGFYRVRVEMVGKRTGKVEYHRTITLAIVHERGETEPGEFGWTLPTADSPLPYDTLQELLPQVGVSWVKLPVWFEEAEPQVGEKIITFVEQLSANDIETVGVLEEPRRADRRAVGERASSEVAGVFSADPSVWQPQFDHLMTRLSLRIRWWQLGFDHDTSFVGYQDLVAKVAAIRKQLYRFGQDVRVGLGWRWDTPTEPGRKSWEFEQMSSRPPLDARRLDEKLSAPRASTADRWVLIEPEVDESRFATPQERLEARIRELVEQVVVAKHRGANAIFVPNPFSGEREVGEGALMCVDGTPGELLLPWRTTATMLSGAAYLGELTLPGGSRNWLFERGGQVVMVLWNDRPTDEVLYLGDDVRHVNVWGQSRVPEVVETEPGFRRQVIRVGRLPSFVRGVNGAVARLRMSVRLQEERVPSVFAERHPNRLTARNPFPQGVGGELRLLVPDMTDRADDEPRPLVLNNRASKEWRLRPQAGEFSTAPGGLIEHPFDIQLKDATYGRQPLRIDLDLLANQRYRFSVWRELQVGLGTIEIGVKTSIDPNNRLVVKQRMVNRTDQRLDFRCLLDAPGKRRKRVQVFQLGAEGDDKVFTYSGGSQLLGKELKLRAEEVNGSRVIVHRFVVEE